MDPILTKAMLVHLEMHAWTAHRLDRAATRTTTRAYQADERESGGFNKRLLPRNALQEIQAKQREARKLHYHHTLPWDDAGGSKRMAAPRLLTSRNYKPYTDAMDQVVLDHSNLVPVLVDHYDDYRSQQRATLGGMYNPADYPTKASLRERFQVAYRIQPVPAGHHFLAELNGDVDRVRAQIDADKAHRLAEASKALYRRIGDALTHMRERLGEGRDGQPNVFRDTLFENMKELIDVAPRLNVFEDPTVDALCAEIKDKITWVEPERVRPTSAHFDPNLRDHVKRNTEDLLTQFAGYFGDPQ